MTVHFTDIYGTTYEFVSVVGFHLRKTGVNKFSCSLFTTSQNHSESYPHRFLLENIQDYIPSHGDGGHYFEYIFSIDLHGFAKIEVTDNISILNTPSDSYREVNSVLIQMDLLKLEDNQNKRTIISVNIGDIIEMAEESFGSFWLI